MYSSSSPSLFIHHLHTSYITRNQNRFLDIKNQNISTKNIISIHTQQQIFKNEKKNREKKYPKLSQINNCNTCILNSIIFFQSKNYDSSLTKTCRTQNKMSKGHSPYIHVALT